MTGSMKYILKLHTTQALHLRNYFSLLKTFTRSKSKWEKCTNFLCLSLLLALWIGAFNTDNNEKILGPTRKKTAEHDYSRLSKICKLLTLFGPFLLI